MGDSEGATAFAPGFGYKPARSAEDRDVFVCYARMVRFCVPAPLNFADPEPCSEMCTNVVRSLQHLIDNRNDLTYMDMSAFEWLLTACSSNNPMAKCLGCHYGQTAIRSFEREK
jgi:hypothetical protein